MFVLNKNMLRMFLGGILVVSTPLFAMAPDQEKPAGRPSAVARSTSRGGVSSQEARPLYWIFDLKLTETSRKALENFLTKNEPQGRAFFYHPVCHLKFPHVTHFSGDSYTRRTRVVDKTALEEDAVKGQLQDFVEKRLLGEDDVGNPLSDHTFKLTKITPSLENPLYLIGELEDPENYLKQVHQYTDNLLQGLAIESREPLTPPREKGPFFIKIGEVARRRGIPLNEYVLKAQTLATLLTEKLKDNSLELSFEYEVGPSRDRHENKGVPHIQQYWRNELASSSPAVEGAAAFLSTRPSEGPGTHQ